MIDLRLEDAIPPFEVVTSMRKFDGEGTMKFGATGKIELGETMRMT
jgi:hypothetical protein